MKKATKERYYETMIIWDTGLSTEELDKEITRVKETIEKTGGECLKIDKWGKRRLAYEIKKKKEGIYVVIDFKGTPEILSQLFDLFKFDKNVIRHMSLQKEAPVLEKAAEPEQAEEGEPVSTEEENE